MQKAEFAIQGMTCSSCAAHVDKAVNQIKGVSKVSVNLLSNRMTLYYDETMLKPEAIIKTVAEAGYGASLINASEKKDNTNRYDQTTEIYSIKKRFLLSLTFLVILLFVSMQETVFQWLHISTLQWYQEYFSGNENALTYALVQFVLLIPIIWLNRQYYITGLKRLFRFSPNMDSLIAIGSGISALYSVFAIFRIHYGIQNGEANIVEHYRTHLYFESCGMILTLITFGKYLEAKSKGKTSDAIRKLIHLAPKTAIIWREEREVEVDTEEIKKEDIVIIKPGSSIPVDGIIIEGSSSIDQSSMTGESIPVYKTVNDTVIAGTINQNGYFRMKATKVGEDTTLAQMIQLVEEASHSKAPISKLADKVSLIFVPTVIFIAFLTTILWLVSGQTFEFAMEMGISVLVISCPCALGLATPVAIMVGTGRGAEKGVLFKTAESLERLHQVDTVVLDKTGTITNGKPIVTDIVTFISEKELLQIAKSLEEKSEHPLSEAILQAANEIEEYPVKNYQSIPGKGVCGEINEKQYFVGNLTLLQEHNIAIEEDNSQLFKEAGKTVLYVANEQKVLGMIACQDTVKEKSEIAIQTLLENPIDVFMLTGDHPSVANAIAHSLGIQKIIAGVLPTEKEKEITKIQKEGKIVAFVGDGINDSPALAKADVGLAIGSGTDIAIDSADVILMKNNLQDVVTAIQLSKATIQNIKMNLFWAFFYNSIGIPIAAGAFYLSYGLRLSPMLGALAMSFSSVCVVTNALRLKKFQPKFSIKNKEIKKEKEIMEEKAIELKIEGMMCEHCKMRVEQALMTVEGVKKVEVNLADKKASIVITDYVSKDALQKVVEEAGYKVIGE